MKKSKIADLSAYVPAKVVTNGELESRIHFLPAGSLERLFGSRERRFAAVEEQVSDLAVAAARPIVDRVGAGNIDFLIFSAACADLIEPATCNIVQHKLGLDCPAMDIKNACNSFTSGMMTACSFIASGMYESVLVVTGEKLSDAIRFEPKDEEQLRRSLAAYSLGDAGAAVLIRASDDESGFHFQRFMTRGEHWPLCTIRGGGSLHPHDADKHFFEGQTAALKEVLAISANQFFHDCLREAGWQPTDIQHLFTHQVSAELSRLIPLLTRVPASCFEDTFSRFGNTAAASIPLAMYQRQQRGALQKGDRFALIGLAAGVSVSVQLGIW